MDSIIDDLQRDADHLLAAWYATGQRIDWLFIGAMNRQELVNALVDEMILRKKG